jgi:hypothetical protein
VPSNSFTKLDFSRDAGPDAGDGFHVSTSLDDESFSYLFNGSFLSKQLRYDKQVTDQERKLVCFLIA